MKFRGYLDVLRCARFPADRREHPSCRTVLRASRCEEFGLHLTKSRAVMDIETELPYTYRMHIAVNLVGQTDGHCDICNAIRLCCDEVEIACHDD